MRDPWAPAHLIVPFFYVFDNLLLLSLSNEAARLFYVVPIQNILEVF